MAKRTKKLIENTSLDDAIRLNKYISDAGLCSRREADQYIASGEVTVDGEVATTGTKVMPGQKVVFRGKPVEPEEKLILIAFNKPRGIVCTTDRREKDNIIDYINYGRRIYPIGRLDKDSEGIILLTNDGNIVNKILRAGNNHEKEYIVEVNKTISAEFLKGMTEGVPILDTVTLPCKIKTLGKTTFQIILTQGLNRQIRRMCEYYDYKVLSLKRVRIMNINIGHLQLGGYRNVTEKEIAGLNELLSESVNSPSFIEQNKVDGEGKRTKEETSNQTRGKYQARGYQHSKSSQSNSSQSNSSHSKSSQSNSSHSKSSQSNSSQNKSSQSNSSQNKRDQNNSNGNNKSSNSDKSNNFSKSNNLTKGNSQSSYKIQGKTNQAKSYQEKNNQEKNDFQDRKSQGKSEFQDRKSQGKSEFQDRRSQGKSEFQDRRNQGKSDFQDKRNQGRSDFQDRRNQGKSDFQDRRNQEKSDFQDRKNQGKSDFQDRRKQGKSDFQDRRNQGKSDFQDKRNQGKSDFQDRRNQGKGDSQENNSLGKSYGQRKSSQANTKNQFKSEKPFNHINQKNGNSQDSKPTNGRNYGRKVSTNQRTSRKTK
jgi:23S rRNA pseudouridine2604 synthase